MLSNIFYCPLCNNPIKKQKNFVVCIRCKRIFPIISDIYDFFIQENLSTQDKLTGKFFAKIFKLFSIKDRKGLFNTISLSNLFGFKSTDFSNKRILDAGTGFGRIVKEICNYNPEYVVGLDIAMDSLKTAKKFVDDKRALFTHVDLNHTPFLPETFDWVISLGVIHHISDLEESLDSLVKLCKPEGKLLIAVLGRKGFIPYLRWLIRLFTLRIPFSIAERVLKYIPVSTSWKYTISDTLWAPIYHQRSFKQMEKLLKQRGVKTVRQLEPYRKHNPVWRFLQGEGYMHLLAVKEGV